MLFNSYQFLIFFPIVVLIYFVIPDRVKYLWLLAASWYFYMCWNPAYIILILISTVVTWTSGILMERADRGDAQEQTKTAQKKLIVSGSVILNLGILFYFKYFDFGIRILCSLFGLLHIELVIPEFDILLPVGISFYTFQALGYTIDVYREDIQAEKNFFRYALFVSFFPQLVAGPIERSGNLLHQLEKPSRFSLERTKDGFLQMLWGYFLKIVLADRIGIFVDTAYGDTTTYYGWYLIIASVLFFFQIYCDFYGYSSIAKGAAEILGIELMENFNAPFFSLSVPEFWSRWHISLTTWFRDYLYIPLGGNRKGRWRKYLNNIIVFTASGLWHGAAWHYVAWGFVNGVYQVAGDILKPLRNKAVHLLGLHRDSLGHKLLRCWITFFLTDLSVVFFRASGMGEAFSVIKKMFTASNPWVLFDGWTIYECGLDRYNFQLMVVCLIILLFADWMKRKGIQIREVILQQDVWFQSVLVIFFICAILLFGQWGPAYDASSFIYFQF